MQPIIKGSSATNLYSTVQVSLLDTYSILQVTDVSVLKYLFILTPAQTDPSAVMELF